ncbi:GAF and ANTAR domain-containing protein [Nocardioides pacificus]
MTARTAVQVFAEATHAVVEQRDAHDTLARLLSGCLEVLDADAAGVMVVADGGELELLAATSHRVEELELYQAQADRGPCRDVIHAGEALALGPADALVERWGEVGRAVVDAGFDAVAAFPVMWQGRVLGGLNVFRSSERAEVADELGQAFADVISLLLVRSLDLSVDELSARIRSVLAGRSRIEQAKGVLAFQESIAIADAYDRLVELSRKRGRPIGETAAWVVEQAAAGPDRGA